EKSPILNQNKISFSGFIINILININIFQYLNSFLIIVSVKINLVELSKGQQSTIFIPAQPHEINEIEISMMFQNASSHVPNYYEPAASRAILCQKVECTPSVNLQPPTPIPYEYENIENFLEGPQFEHEFIGENCMEGPNQYVETPTH
ncbi:hypothetical protein Mgra_00009606, partial [Meloidogyne graminicola]